MANTLANISDWWLNKLNTSGILPANVASLARSISAKHLGDKNFRPRPITADNFTPAELDVIYRLSHAPDGSRRSAVIQGYYKSDIYDKSKGGDTTGVLFDKGGVLDYMNPARVVHTTLGAYTVDNGRIKDTYDFNHSPLSLQKDKAGRIRHYGRIVAQPGDSEEKVKEYVRKLNKDRSDGAYGRMRVNALRLAHTDKDPDELKIKTNFSLADIRRRLGASLGTHDLTKGMSRREFLTRGIAAGGLTGLGAGAALGLTGGALSLYDKDRRKRWARTLLYSTLVGAGIAGAAGAALGGAGAHKILKSFTKAGAAPAVTPAVPSADAKKKNRKNRWKYALSGLVALGLPLAAVAGIGAVGVNKARKIGNGLFGPADKSTEADIITTEY